MWLILVSKIIHQHKWSTLQNLTTGFSFWNSDICWLVSAEGNPRPYIAKLFPGYQSIIWICVCYQFTEWMSANASNSFVPHSSLSKLSSSNLFNARKEIYSGEQREKNNLPSISYNHIISYDVLLVFVRHKKNQSKTVWLILININVD